MFFKIYIPLSPLGPGGPWMPISLKLTKPFSPVSPFSPLCPGKPKVWRILSYGMEGFDWTKIFIFIFQK